MFSLNSVRVAPGVRSALAVACGVVSCLPVAAWSADSEMAPVVVTATRGTARISDLVADVTVIDSARLAAASGQSLLSLLAEEPGLQFAANGGLGKSGSVYIRGGESRHTLLLVDGVRYGSATLGQPLLENLPVALIERIEIVRGPMSSLYGSDAAAGVIQVFTKRGKSGLSPYGAVTVGTDSYFQTGAGLSGGTDEVTFNAGAQYQYSQGGSASNPRASQRDRINSPGRTMFHPALVNGWSPLKRIDSPSRQLLSSTRSGAGIWMPWFWVCQATRGRMCGS